MAASNKKSRGTPPPPLHELEGAVMEYIWSAGESSVRDVMLALNDAGATKRAYTTYMTIMARLEKKGLLLRRREGKADYYRAAHARDEYMELRARAEVEELVDQFGDVALSSFARQMAALDPARRRRLQRLARQD
jgi:predicted transcriptional regulator